MLRAVYAIIAVKEDDLSRAEDVGKRVVNKPCLQSTTGAAAVRIKAMAIINEVEAMISMRPGLTETELAKALYGLSGYPQQVNAACRTLLRRGRIERRGKGYSEPFTYFKAGTGTS